MNPGTPAGTRSIAERALEIATEIRQMIDSSANTIVLGDGHTRVQLKVRVLCHLDDLEEVLSEIPS